MRAVWRAIDVGDEVIAEKWIENWEDADKRCPADVERHWVAGKVLIYVSFWKKPGTPWSREARARNRKRRLRNRLEKKFPMFADQFYERELRERPRYFDATHPYYDKGRPGGPT